MRSDLNRTLDDLYNGHIDNLLKWGKPIDKVLVDRKTLTAYPLSEEEIQMAEAGVVHHKTDCELCKGIDL